MFAVTAATMMPGAPWGAPASASKLNSTGLVSDTCRPAGSGNNGLAPSGGFEFE